MNQEYILLAGLYWRLRGIKLEMWRNHYSGSFLTDIAAKLCNRVYFTSNSSYTARFKHAVRMPIGLDESIFTETEAERKTGSLLYVGRVSRSKRIDMILEAIKKVLSDGKISGLTVVGPTTSDDDEQYLAELKDYVNENSLPVTFAGSVPWETLPDIYTSHELCINMSPPGMFDKVIGESVLCGCDIVTTNLDLAEVLGNRAIPTADSESLANFFRGFSHDKGEISQLRSKIIEMHALSSLVKKVLHT